MWRAMSDEEMSVDSPPAAAKIEQAVGTQFDEHSAHTRTAKAARECLDQCSEIQVQAC